MAAANSIATQHCAIGDLPVAPLGHLGSITSVVQGQSSAAAASGAQTVIPLGYNFPAFTFVQELSHCRRVPRTLRELEKRF